MFTFFGRRCRSWQRFVCVGVLAAVALTAAEAAKAETVVPTDARASMEARLKSCGQVWGARKAAGQTQGQTFTEFVAGCLTGDAVTAAPARPVLAAVTADPVPTSAPQVVVSAASEATPASRQTSAAKPAAPARIADADIQRCKSGWTDHKEKAKVAGLKAWHAWMAQCLP